MRVDLQHTCDVHSLLFNISPSKHGNGCNYAHERAPPGTCLANDWIKRTASLRAAHCCVSRTTRKSSKGEGIMHLEKGQKRQHEWAKNEKYLFVSFRSLLGLENARAISFFQSNGPLCN